MEQGTPVSKVQLHQMYLDRLVKDKEWIATPSHWCIGTYAMTRSGKAVDWNNPNAFSFDALGVVRRHDDVEYRVYAETLLEAAAATLYGSHSVMGVNDDGGHTAVLLLFEEAIRRAKGVLQMYKLAEENTTN